MTIKEAQGIAADNMTLVARHYKDKGVTAWSAQHHSLAVGLATQKAIAGGLESNAGNYAALYQTLGNHSAWRQKFEKLDIFPKAMDRTVDASMKELEEEFG